MTRAHLAFLLPSGQLARAAVALESPRILLPLPPAPPVVVPPQPLPDIPWTTDPTRTVDMLTYVTAAASARRDRGDGTGQLWLHKSQERDNWGENWDFDHDYIGFEEDRSTGTRMVSMERPKTHSHTNTERNRLSPEEILERNANGENLGDPLTLPLAGYTWDGNRVWMIRHVTGQARLSFHTDFKWWDLPEFGGVWEIWANLPLTIEVQTGYARLNGHDVFARSRYGKPAGNEWNYWGPHGWIAFMAYHADGSEDLAARRVAPPEQRASPLTAPFVDARFVPTYPIYDAAREQPPVQETDDMTAADIRRYAGELNDPLVFGALQRYHNEVLPRDRPMDGVVTAGDGSDMWTGDVVTGGANGYFVRSYISEYLIARDKGRTAAEASGDGYDKAIAAYRQVVNPQPPVPQPPVQPGTFRAPISAEGRDFVAPA